MKQPFKWDNYSDQPAIIEDKVFKKQMRKKEFLSLIKTIFTSLVIVPFSTMMMPYVKRKDVKIANITTMVFVFATIPH